jgi:2'-5' RNA ligase
VPEPLQQLWQDLRHALVLAGQGRHVARSFTPHVTVAYSHAALLDATPLEPVAWRVERVALIHSVVGQQDYQVLAEWSLQTVA